MFISLDEAKAQLSILVDDATHNAKINRLILAAEAWAANYVNAPLADYQDSGDSPLQIPEDIKSALLLHVEAHFDRDPQTMQQYIDSAELLLGPHRQKLGI
jgi:hypothetical protein